MDKPEPRKERCGAKTRHGTPCKKWAVEGRNRCRNHGGATPRGPASANYKHGRFSVLNGELGRKVQAMLDDENLLDLRRGPALLLEGVRQSSERLEEGDTPKFRRDALERMDAAIETMKKDPAAGVTKLTLLRRFLSTGVVYDKAFSVMLDRAERYSHSVTQAQRVLVQGSNAMNVTFLLQAIGQFVQVVGRYVDERVQRSIYAEFDRITDGALSRAGVPLGESSE